MRRKRPSRRGLCQAFALALMLGWLSFLRPTWLGGPASYMLVVGQSMEPTLAQGTLIVSLRQSVYSVGDVVVFVPPQGHGDGSMVVHRLVEGSAETGYVTQGDNNLVPDPWTVGAERVVGRPVLVAPGAASLVSVVRSPILVASLTTAFLTYALAGFLIPPLRYFMRPQHEQRHGATRESGYSVTR